MNFGLSLDELQSGRPMIGIAQAARTSRPATATTWCWRSARRHPATPAASPSNSRSIRSGDLQAADSDARPQPAVPEPGRAAVRLPDRRRDLTTGCDKTRRRRSWRLYYRGHPGHRAELRPMLNGWHEGERTGSGTIVLERRASCWPRARSTTASSSELVASVAPSTGHCNTMGTASTMNSLAEALGLTLPGTAAIPRRTATGRRPRT